jgi:tRNA threonylcarbamoyladenosine biosynthesis protein TsaB
MAPVIALVLEAATYAGSAALLDDGRLLGERSVAMRGREREALLPAVGDLLADHAVDPRRLGRVICGAGPGSFTSLRIAGGIGKGLALAAGAPLVPVSSLALLVASRPLPPGLYLAALDALRGEHYVERYEVAADGAIAAVAPTTLVGSAELGRTAERLGATLLVAGPGGEGPAPHARGAARLGALLAASGPADLARWEPAYGRLAEAQVKWEAAHGQPLQVT